MNRAEKIITGIGIVITILIIFCVMTGCVTYERCTEKYGVTRSDTVRVPFEKIVAVSVPMPMDTVRISVDCDSLGNGTIRTNGDYLQGSATPDGSKVNFMANILPKVITKIDTIRDTVFVPVKTTTLVEPPKAWYKRLWYDYGSQKSWAVIGLLLTIFIGVLLKKIKVLLKCF